MSRLSICVLYCSLGRSLDMFRLCGSTECQSTIEPLGTVLLIELAVVATSRFEESRRAVSLLNIGSTCSSEKLLAASILEGLSDSSFTAHAASAFRTIYSPLSSS